MTAIASEVDQTLRSLDPQRASALERSIRAMLTLVKERPAGATSQIAKAAVDANGWPIGYWEKYAGCLAGDDWEPQPDPPPGPHPE